MAAAIMAAEEAVAEEVIIIIIEEIWMEAVIRWWRVVAVVVVAIKGNSISIRLQAKRWWDKGIEVESAVEYMTLEVDVVAVVEAVEVVASIQATTIQETTRKCLQVIFHIRQVDVSD